MKRFKYYKTEQGLYFQDNLENKLLYYVDEYTSKFKTNWTIENNRLFENLNWKEKDWVFLNIEHQEIYSIADETNEHFICDVFEESFIILTDLKIVKRVDENDNFKGNESSYVLIDNKFKEQILEHNINHFLNS